MPENEDLKCYFMKKYEITFSYNQNISDIPLYKLKSKHFIKKGVIFGILAKRHADSGIFTSMLR